MKRTPMKPRTTPLRSGGRIRPKKRRASETLRIYGGEARIQFVAGLPCVVLGCKRVPSENCHAETGGMGRKADADKTFPGCPTHHRELHAVGQHTFARIHGLDLTRTAERIANAWRARHPMTAVGEILPDMLPDVRDGAA